MTSLPLCYFGSTVPLPLRKELRAGGLTAIYEAGDLRYVRCGPFEVVRRWYAAVRGPNWETIPGVLSDEIIDETPDGFRVRYTRTHRSGAIHFVWRADIVATAAGQVSFTFDGEALSTFRRNRIGLCILHPIQECAGAKAQLLRPDGTTTDSQFPKFIAPANPFQELAGLAHELAPGLWCDWKFEGDLFETEDQRNWIDASFKTFCTPLRLPFPVEVAAGTRIKQTVTFTLRGGIPAATPKWTRRDIDAGERGGGRTIDIQEPTSTRLPEIGLRVASHGQPLSDRELVRIRLLRPRHLQVELDLTGGRWRQLLEQTAVEARAMNVPLELAIQVSDQSRRETSMLVSLLRQLDQPIARVLVFHHQSWATTESAFLPAAEVFRGYDPAIRCYAGTLANFMEWNRSRPSFLSQRGVCFSIHPQEHAFDNASLVETCPMIAETVASVRHFSNGLPIAVGPITLKKRLNPYATEPATPLPAGEMPPTFDPRQMSLFGAGWTLSAIKYLAESGVNSATFYETTGWLGVTGRDSERPASDRFPSLARHAYPLFHVLADVCEFPDGMVRRSVSSDPYAVQSFAIDTGEGTRLLLANLTGISTTVNLSGLGSEIQWRMLDETTVGSAGHAETFRLSEALRATTDRGRISLSLGPYAYVRIDSK